MGGYHRKARDRTEDDEMSDVNAAVVTCWNFLRGLNDVCHFMSRERTGKATNSELKRWLQNKAIEINGKRPNWNDPVEFPITQMVLFPKKSRVTLM